MVEFLLLWSSWLTKAAFLQNPGPSSQGWHYLQWAGPSPSITTWKNTLHPDHMEEFSQLRFIPFRCLQIVSRWHKSSCTMTKFHKDLSKSLMVSLESFHKWKCYIEHGKMWLKDHDSKLHIGTNQFLHLASNKIFIEILEIGKHKVLSFRTINKVAKVNFHTTWTKRNKLSVPFGF